MSFCTAVNCMDGRFQGPVTDYLRTRFGVDYVDMITEPGPNRILAEGSDHDLLRSIAGRIRISVEKHGSEVIAIVGHEDCAGNPTGRAEQVLHLAAARQRLASDWPAVQVIALWATLDGSVEDVG